MLSQQDKFETLKHILESKTFIKATTTKVLLKFLVECTIQNKEISAITIGLELFGKKYNPEKSDVNIRVNISHLRKRLIQYYEQEGSKDTIALSIEPGQYQVSFTKKQEPKPHKTRTLLIGLIAAAIVITSLLYIFRSNEKVWHKTITNSKETTLYLGDVFGYDGPTTFGNVGWHRDFKINSPEEFYERVKDQPEKHKGFKPGQFTFVNFENSYIIKPISQYLASYNYDFSIRPTSDFNIRSIKDENTIYAGPYFIQNAFVDLFNEFSKNSKLESDDTSNIPTKLIYQRNNTTKEFHLGTQSTNTEYALTSVFNGPNGTRHHMFFSTHGMGLTALVEYFTNPDSIQSFSNEYLKETDEFIAIYYVKGKDRTNMSMELKFIDYNR